MVSAGEAVLEKAALVDPSFDRQTLVRARARDIFGIFCMGFADGEIDEIGGLLRQSLALSWRPVLLSPRRLFVVAIFLVAKITPHSFFEGVWRVVARNVFGLTPYEHFLPESNVIQQGENAV
jgi:hypothetical protein